MTLRRAFLLSLAFLAAMAAVASFAPSPRLSSVARLLPVWHSAPPAREMPVFARPEDGAVRLTDAGLWKVGVTTRADGAYIILTYQGAVEPLARPMCTDIVDGAFWPGDGHGLPLVHEEARGNFAAPSGRWGLPRPDHGQTASTGEEPDLGRADPAADLYSGEIVADQPAGGVPRIMIVTPIASEDGGRQLCIYDVSAGARLEDVLFADPASASPPFKL